jgi:hypothetical protein
MVLCLAGAKYFFASPKYANGSESLPPLYAVVGEATLSGLKWPVCEADRSPPSSTAVESEWIYSSIPPYTFMLYTRKTLIFCHSALWWGVDMAVHWNMIGWACGILAVCVSDTSCDNSMTTLYYHLVFISFCVFLSCRCQMWVCSTKVCTELLLLLLLLASILLTLLSLRPNTDGLFLLVTCCRQQEDWYPLQISFMGTACSVIVLHGIYFRRNNLPKEGLQYGRGIVKTQLNLFHCFTVHRLTVC